MNSLQLTNSNLIPVNSIPNIPLRPNNELGVFTQAPVAPVAPVLPPVDTYYKYPYNNREKYTNWKIIRYRDFLYPDVYPIVQSDRYQPKK